MNTKEKITACKDITSIFAAVCIAIWAVYSMWIKNEERIADLEVTKLEQDTKLRSRIILEMKTQIMSKHKDETIIKVDIELTNKGNHTARVLLEDEALSILKVKFNENSIDYNDLKYFGSYRYRGQGKMFIGDYIDISGDETYKISFVTKVIEPGLYLIRSLIKKELFGPEREDHGKYGGGKEDTKFIHKAVGTDEYIFIN